MNYGEGSCYKVPFLEDYVYWVSEGVFCSGLIDDRTSWRRITEQQLENDLLNLIGLFYTSDTQFTLQTIDDLIINRGDAGVYYFYQNEWHPLMQKDCNKLIMVLEGYFTSVFARNPEALRRKYEGLFKMPFSFSDLNSLSIKE